MKKLDKILSILIIVLMLACICSNVFARVDIGEIDSNKTIEGDVDSKMQSIGSTIFTMITNVGIILSVIIVAVLGVKYMMGSTEEKAEYKKSMMPYLVGALLVFSASTIGKIVMNAANV